MRRRYFWFWYIGSGMAEQEGWRILRVFTWMLMIPTALVAAVFMSTKMLLSCVVVLIMLGWRGRSGRRRRR